MKMARGLNILSLQSQALQLAETLLPLQNRQQVLTPQHLPRLSLLMVIAATPMD